MFITNITHTTLTVANLSALKHEQRWIFLLSEVPDVDAVS